MPNVNCSRMFSMIDVVYVTNPKLLRSECDVMLLLIVNCGRVPMESCLRDIYPCIIWRLYFQVNRNRHQLLYFLLFIRIFPMTPNWFVNMASPIVGVPLHMFCFSVFVGKWPIRTAMFVSLGKWTVRTVMFVGLGRPTIGSGP